MNGENELLRRLYMHLAVSFGFGFIILLWAYGFYGIINTKEIYPQPPYIALIFTLFFISSSILLENRGVEMPYLLVGGALISSIATFVAICVVSGVFWLGSNGPPSLDIFLLGISLSSLTAFIILKLVTSKG